VLLTIEKLNNNQQINGLINKRAEIIPIKVTNSSSELGSDQDQTEIKIK
jgi:hypothetical protein